MFTSAEEAALKNLAKQNLPLPRPAIIEHPPVNVGKHIFKNVTGKMPVQNTDEDYETIARVNHTMKKNETLREWYARTGLAKASLETMSTNQITDFVEQAEKNNKAEGFSIRKHSSTPAVKVKPATPHFLLT